MGAAGWGVDQWGVDELLWLGRWMDARPGKLMKAAEGLLKVRDREGVERPLRANAAQRAFEAQARHHSAKPPSRAKATPVMKDASGEQR